MKVTIQSINARQILSGTGKPTIEVEIGTNNGILCSASVPMGSSTGTYEASEIRDTETFSGSMNVAVYNVEHVIAPVLIGMDVTEQKKIDDIMCDLDGTLNKSRIGANAILGVSVAVTKAAAAAVGRPVYQYLGGYGPHTLPVPVATVIAGGSFSPSSLGFEDYCFVMDGFDRFSDSLWSLVKARSVLKDRLLIEHPGGVTEIGGALAPPIEDTEEAFELLAASIKECDLDGRVHFGLDAAANEFISQDRDFYIFEGEKYTPTKMGEKYREISEKYPLLYLEDPFHEDEFGRFYELTSSLEKTSVVGDDLYASNKERIGRSVAYAGELSYGGIAACSDEILIKINQIGTVSEALEAVQTAREANIKIAVSVRSHETNDDFIADFAVAVDAIHMKIGSPVRGERNAKYNRLLKIEQELGEDARFAGC